VRYDRDAKARVVRARERRSVWWRQLEDGMGSLGVVSDWSTIHAIATTVAADGRALQLTRGGAAAVADGDEAATADACRADALAARMLGTVTEDGSVSWDRTQVQVSVNVVMDLDTPRRETDHLDAPDAPDAPDTTDTTDTTDMTETGVRGDGGTASAPVDSTACDSDAADSHDGVTGSDATTSDPAEPDAADSRADRVGLAPPWDSLAIVDGQPVPGEIAREIARFATSWTRMVTDPVDGHLLDYGRTVYLPDTLRRYVLARDGTCRTPICSHRGRSRMEMDHARPFPDGSSSAANCGALHTTCHQLKTAGLLDLTDTAADGSATWRTAWGQVIHIPAPAYLDDPRDHDDGTPHLPDDRWLTLPDPPPPPGPLDTPPF
jgi:hypothetical protein